jgi:hypothetical protein
MTTKRFLFLGLIVLIFGGAPVFENMTSFTFCNSVLADGIPSSDTTDA